MLSEVCTYICLNCIIILKGTCRRKDIFSKQLIQVDIGGHPPFPTGSKQFSDNFGNLLFLVGFNFRGHFEGLNEGFLRLRFSMIA
jgi:hypothetical protein